MAHCWVAQALEAKGEYQAASAEYEEGVRLSNRGPWTLGFLGHGYASGGRPSDARRVIEELLDLRSTRYISGYDIALVCVGLGDSDGALTWLEQAETDPAHQMAFPQGGAAPRPPPLLA